MLVKNGPADLDSGATEVPPVNEANSLGLGNSPSDGGRAMSKAEGSFDSIPEGTIVSDKLRVSGATGGDSKSHVCGLLGKDAPSETPLK